MKKKKTYNRTTKSFSITVPAEFLPEIKRMADKAGRSVSNYLSLLIAQDICALRNK